MRRFAVAAGALMTSATAAGAPSPALLFRDQAAEVSAASRLVSAYGVVTSTFRTVAHNRAVGGVPNSYHLLDRAIDIARRPGITHRQIEWALRKAGFNLVESLDEVDHSHFAFAPVASKPVRQAEESASPPPPSAPPPPRVAADVHGTLALDLQSTSGTGTAPDAASR